jgi:hypothetical protein
MYMITYAFGRVKKSEMRKAEKENDKRKETEWQKKKRWDVRRITRKVGLSM